MKSIFSMKPLLVLALSVFVFFVLLSAKAEEAVDCANETGSECVKESVADILRLVVEGIGIKNFKLAFITFFIQWKLFQIASQN